MIAMALACDPAVLIADEPTTALDVMVQAQVLDLLQRLQRERNLAVLFITHDLSVLTYVCDHLAVMYAGRIVEEGPSDVVFEDPQHPYTRALAAAFPTIGDPTSRMRPSGLEGDPPDPQHLPTGCPFHPRCDVVEERCPTLDVRLSPAGPGRRAACVKVGTSAPGRMSHQPAPLLEVSDLHVHFGAKGRAARRHAPARAVDGVTLEVREGEVVALVGESGCGKTTLARTIMGLERPVHGEVRFEGRPILGRGGGGLHAYRKQVQMVFQDPTGALNPRQTIYEAVAEGLRVHRVGGDEETLVAGALSRSGLRPPERFVGLYPHEVSGGQRQRVVIAGAMVLEPRLLVADEPVSSLDASVRGEILKLMRGLVDETGVAILVVTHDLGLAWNVADRVAVMYLGRIVELGPTEQILEKPATSVHEGVALGGAGDPPGRAADPRGRDARPEAHPRGVPFPPALPARRERARPSASASSSAARAKTRTSTPSAPRTPLRVTRSVPRIRPRPPERQGRGTGSTSALDGVQPAVRMDQKERRLSTRSLLDGVLNCRSSLVQSS